MTLRSSFRFTYNFTNQSTQYQNGVDMAASAAFSNSVISRLMRRSSGFYNIVRPDNGPTRSLRVQVSLLFPDR